MKPRFTDTVFSLLLRPDPNCHRFRSPFVGPSQPMNFNSRLQQCPNCSLLTDNIQKHVREYHHSSIFIDTHRGRRRFSRYSDGKFVCPVCRERYTNSCNFRVSNALSFASARATQFVTFNFPLLSARTIFLGAVLREIPRLGRIGTG